MRVFSRERIVKCLMVLAVAAAALLGLSQRAQASTYVSDDYTYTGVDVSYYQGTIDWEEAADDIDFAILRLGHGDYVDSQFEYNASMCEKYGIPYGVYFYSTAKSVSGAKKDAKICIKNLKGYSPDLPVFWDVEDSSVFKSVSTSKLSKMAFAFCNKISNAGYKAGVYSSVYYWYTYLDKFAKKDTKYCHWVAAYRVGCVAYADEAAIEALGYSWATYKSYHYYNIWQYSSSGKVSWDGSTYIDLDKWYGSLNLTKLKKVTTNQKSISLKWKKATSAKKYVVYRKEDGGKYKKIATVKTNTYTDKTAKSGKHYTYKIKVVTGNGVKDTSNKKSTWFLKTPTILKAVKKSKTTAKVTWTKSGGSSGYQIQYTTSSKNFKKSKKITVGSKTTLKTLLENLKKGKTYYIRIRSYKKTDDGKVYSEWSDKVKVKL
ncbi:MAG: fibronectin type III domain-containing protein [Eubacterium sp.]|nr:fibronectin type III domain-containing protein [Eubacterium sp.]